MYKAPRGTSDILPADQAYWKYITQKAFNLGELYGYRRIDTPTLEDSRLFMRSIGEETDIVEKEMYTLEDRSGDRLTLRPEGTASVCRAYVEHGMRNLTQPVRLYYYASIFRYERPQAGRYREHHQFGVEAIGEGDAAIDSEIIDIAWQFYANLGLKDLVLYLNSIGCSECRSPYLESLKHYYSEKKEKLCPDCRRRLVKNPLRLLDCKKPSCTPLTEKAPRSIDYLCTECSRHFDQLQRYLSILDLPFVVEHRLVRGLDYYTKTVFEIAPQGEVVAQATLAAGGRYDNLIEQLGGRPTPAIGFATGIERLVLNLKKQKTRVPEAAPPTVFFAYMGQEAKDEALKLISQMRKSGVNIVLATGDRSLKAQLKQANSIGAKYTVIMGEDEVKDRAVVLRDMDKAEQLTVSMEEVIDKLIKK